jgi:hypothetical protein
MFMELNKKIDINKLKTSIIDRYKFLFKSTFGTDIILLDFDIIDMEVKKDNTLDNMFLLFNVDYNKSIDNSFSGISGMLRIVQDKLIEFLYEYPLNPKTFRFDKNVKDFFIGDGFFTKVDYQLEEKHEITMEVIINFGNE